MSTSTLIELFLLLVIGLGPIAVAAFLIMMTIATLKNSGSIVKKAFIVLLVYVLALGVTIAMAKFQRSQFDRIPELAVDDNQITILNSGSASWGSHAKYTCSQEGIIKEIDTPLYVYVGATKFGFTFESVAAGNLYLLVVENDFGCLEYADIYEVKVNQEGSIAAEKVEHIPHMQSVTTEKFVEHLVDQYGFSRDVLKEY